MRYIFLPSNLYLFLKTKRRNTNLEVNFHGNQELATLLKRINLLMENVYHSGIRRSIRMTQTCFRALQNLFFMKFSELKKSFKKSFKLPLDGDCFATVRKMEQICGRLMNIINFCFRFEVIFIFYPK